MKREFLEGLGLKKDIMDRIMSEHGASVEKLKTEKQTLETHKGNLAKQLEDVNKEMQGFKDLDIDGIKQKADEWEAKYLADKNAWEKEKSDRQYVETIKNSLEDIKFSSNAAKEAVIFKIKEKGLPTQDGKLEGFDEFINQLKTGDPGAFIEDFGAKVNTGLDLAKGADLSSDSFMDAFKGAAGIKND